MLSTLITIDLIINEIMASNIEGSVSPATNFDGWIELYNSSDTTVNLAGMYLSDEPDNLTKWRMPAAVGKVPAQGYKVVWLGSNDIKRQQAPFKLDCDGGTIILSSADGTAVAQEHYPEALSRTAHYAAGELIVRSTAANEWLYITVTTPMGQNVQRLNAPATGSCTIVPLTLPQGIYTAMVHTSSSASATVKFIIKLKINNDHDYE